MLTSNFDPAGRRVLQHDMLDEDRLLHAVPARRWPFGIICRYQATTLMRTWVGQVVVHHHPWVHPFLALSACLGEAQIEQTPANQAINCPKLKAVFFTDLHLPSDFLARSLMCSGGNRRSEFRWPTAIRSIWCISVQLLLIAHIVHLDIVVCGEFQHARLIFGVGWLSVTQNSARFKGYHIWQV